MLERVWKDGNPPALLVGMQIGTATVEDRMEIPLKTNNRATIWPCNLTPGHTSGGKYGPKGCMHPNVHGSTVYYSQDQCPLTEEWTKEMWLIYTAEYYSATKKNEIKPLAATWMDLENIILSEVRKGEISYIIPYMWNLKTKWYIWTYLQNRKRLTDLENKLTVAEGIR